MEWANIFSACFWLSEAGATIVAAVLAAGIAVGGYMWQQRQSRADKRAVMYSEALRAVEDYAEAPFLVRRRQGKDARATVSTQISEIQSRLALSAALLTISANTHIAEAYDNLVAMAKSTAGPAMTEAWNSRRLRHDSEVPCPAPYDRSAILEARKEYLAAIRQRDRVASRLVNG
ncbi:hypothetical protein GCM10010458_26970 [Microbacterium luteolum]|uniref:DUF2489 domain-containing protein n=1 Tax=Microbacterium luteolum TaxID=69367 RepID=A0ABY7XSZ0_MICLT|nr:hypothetical protein [Microbacterium luteolum]WDM45313.1 hypothetical protein KV395_19575 [Microbacterium luteolum]